MLTFSPEQNAAKDSILRGQNTIVCGAAGSGKSTLTAHTLPILWNSNRLTKLTSSTKWLRAGDPAMVVLGFTRLSVANFRSFMPKDSRIPALTFHKLLEYAPLSPESRIFVPTYGEHYKLPHIDTIVIEESSMVDNGLFQNLINALPNPENTQWVILGDIQQLTPPIGKSIFRTLLLDNRFEKIELTKVYRQAEGSPILETATSLLSGTPLKPQRSPELSIVAFPREAILDAHTALQYAFNGLKNRWKNKQYNPDEDIVIVPYRDDKKTSEFTVNHLSKMIASFLDEQLDRPVFTIQSGPFKLHFAVGDRVMFDREPATITAIRKNRSFSGLITEPSKNIDRNGLPKAGTFTDLEFDFSAGDENEDEDYFSQVSHEIQLLFRDNSTMWIDSASQIRNISLAYATTAYAVQGMQSDRVFVFLHGEHTRKALNRETLYTAITRARKELILLADPRYFTEGVKRQLIPGNTLQEKIQHLRKEQNSTTTAF